MNKIINKLKEYETYQDLKIATKITNGFKEWCKYNQCYDFNFIVTEFEKYRPFVVHNYPNNEEKLEYWGKFCSRIIESLQEFGYNKKNTNPKLYNEFINFWYKTLNI